MASLRGNWIIRILSWWTDYGENSFQTWKNLEYLEYLQNTCCLNIYDDSAMWCFTRKTLHMLNWFQHHAFKLFSLQNHHLNASLFCINYLVCDAQPNPCIWPWPKPKPRIVCNTKGNSTTFSKAEKNHSLQFMASQIIYSLCLHAHVPWKSTLTDL